MRFCWLSIILCFVGLTAVRGADQPAAVKLGSPELTAGIPGEGALTKEQIEKWLSNPENHVTLKVELPAGLSVGAGMIHIPEDNPLTKAKIELGRQLYFDTRLSGDSSISCATCHHPDEGYARFSQFGEGIRGQKGGRNSPTSFNRILSKTQFWDGRAASLEEQAKGPIANPIEMGHSHEACITDLKKIEGYRIQFDKIFPNGFSIDNVAKAIASFERVIVTGTSPADYYEQLRSFEMAFKDDIKDLAEFKKEDPDSFAKYTKLKADSESHAINAAAKRGRDLFFNTKSNCTACHAGANFTDELYHNLGIGMDKKEPDLGRFDQTKVEKDKGAFKTPTLRNIAQNRPYMHDGSLKTLEEVVEWYDKGGHPNPYLSDKIKPLKLTADEKKDLVEYMKALTGPLPKVQNARLPK